MFIPPERLREIRWEEAVLRSQVRRSASPHAVNISHGTCHCGSLGCVGVPYFKGWKGPEYGPLIGVPEVVALRFEPDDIGLTREARLALGRLCKLWRSRGSRPDDAFIVRSQLVSPDERDPAGVSRGRVATVRSLLRDYGVPEHLVQAYEYYRVSDEQDEIPRGVVVAIRHAW